MALLLLCAWLAWLLRGMVCYVALDVAGTALAMRPWWPRMVAALAMAWTLSVLFLAGC